MISQKIEDITFILAFRVVFLDIFEIFAEDCFLLRSFRKFLSSGFLPLTRFQITVLGSSLQHWIGIGLLNASDARSLGGRFGLFFFIFSVRGGKGRGVFQGGGVGRGRALGECLWGGGG